MYKKSLLNKTCNQKQKNWVQWQQKYKQLKLPASPKVPNAVEKSEVQ